MSHVYRARDTVIGRTVAVKILTEQGCADPEAKARFLAEARMAGNIQHDNVIQIYDFGEESGRPYMVMEFLVGQDLRDALRTGAAGDLNSRIKIAAQILRALEYVHSKGIVHRDIKPENVHLDKSGKAKLMDFGIAKTEGLALTRAGFALGTPYYMAPEQVLGEKVGECADIYSFGVMLFEMLTGKKPIAGDTVERLFYMILNEPLNLAPLQEAGVPQQLIDLIARCTAKKAADRPQSFAEVRAEIERHLQPTQQTVVAAAPAEQPAGRSGKYFVFAILAVVVLAAAGLIWYKQTTRGRVLPPVLETKRGEMHLVPAGPFQHGADKQQVEVPGFYMDRTEVTNAEYAEFCKATNRPLPVNFPHDRPAHPVVNVTFSDANAFARWAGTRLPDAMEWEKAARGTDGRQYPWGDQADASRASVRENGAVPHDGPVPANSFAQGGSPYGLLHMAGNVAEYVRTEITPSPAALAHFAAILNPPATVNEPWYSIKGGAFNEPLAASVPWEFMAVPARYADKNIGFRCAKDPDR